jgi:Domain of unknown function (DUF222)
MPADNADAEGAGAPQGLSWSYEMDFGALIAAITGADLPDPGAPSAGPSSEGSPAAAPADGSVPAAPAGSPAPAPGSAEEEAEQEAILDDLAELDARAAAEGREDGGRVPLAAVAGRVAERLAPGPDLAAWLATARQAGLDDGDLAAVAGSWRRLASWAQARELAAVAQITSRAAARDENARTGPDGRPSQVTRSAAAEVALELTMSQYGAQAWAHLAVQLTWRLPGTAAALQDGTIDLARARLIAEATSPLGDETARAVEERVLPAAGGQTTGMLRAALRRAVIAADPAGAEERRKDAERRSQVVLYPDQDCTATLAGQRLPAVHAAAAMARIKAMARAVKASGAGGPIDLLCSQIFLGLLLGTQPPIPPPDGAPPGQPGDGPRDDPDDDWGTDPPSGHGDDPHGERPGNAPAGSTGQGRNHGAARGSAGRSSIPRDGSPSDGDPSDGDPSDGDPSDGSRSDGDPAGDVPPPGDQDAPRDDDNYPCPDDSPAGDSGYIDDDDGWPAPDWPGLPALIPPAFTRPGTPIQDGRPVTGLLDVSLPWQVLAGISAGPGYLGRIGPIPASQARDLSRAAARDPGTEWRIIVTTADGNALAVTRIARSRGHPPRPGTGHEPGAGAGTGSAAGPGAGIGLVGRITLTIPEDIAAHPPPPWPESGAGPGSPDGMLSRALRAAATAAARARATMAADAAAGGCAHTAASTAYRPPPRLKEYIAARDLTCRFPRCRQPAWRGDLDHTIPFDDGGRTCRCNLGGLCRTHHILKHHADWKLRQIAPGIFAWTTPAGCTYATSPDIHAV